MNLCYAVKERILSLSIHFHFNVHVRFNFNVHLHFHFIDCRHCDVPLQRHGALGAREGKQHRHLLRGRSLGHALLRLQGRRHLDDDLHRAFLWIYQWQLLLPVGGATLWIFLPVRIFFPPRTSYTISCVSVAYLPREATFQRLASHVTSYY